MGADASREHVVPIEQQVMSRDRSRDVIRRAVHKVDGVRRRDVLYDDLQPRKGRRDISQVLLQEHSLSVEDVHALGRHFPMDEEKNPLPLHGLEDRV